MSTTHAGKASKVPNKKPSLGIDELQKWIPDVPDFPKKGIIFKDITPLLAHSGAFKATIDHIAAPFASRGVQQVAGIESRGFLLASAVAYRLDAGVILIRKKGKLPRKTLSVSYDLEYGIDTVEAHVDSAGHGTKVLLVDDVLATGGTAAASCNLLERLGAEVVAACFLIELDFLKGRQKLQKYDIHSLIHYT